MTEKHKTRAEIEQKKKDIKEKNLERIKTLMDLEMFNSKKRDLLEDLNLPRKSEIGQDSEEDDPILNSPTSVVSLTILATPGDDDAPIRRKSTKGSDPGLLSPHQQTSK